MQSEIVYFFSVKRRPQLTNFEKLNLVQQCLLPTFLAKKVGKKGFV
jgi:hypothetical protein